MKAMKKNRLRMLVAQGSISQQQANELWYNYLRGVVPVGKIPKIEMITAEDAENDIKMLRMLVKQANGFGAKLRVYKPKPKTGIQTPGSQDYEYCVSGKDTIGRDIRMGGTAFWLYDELIRKFTDYF